MAHDQASCPLDSMSIEDVDIAQPLFPLGVATQSIGRDDITDGHYNNSSSRVIAIRGPALPKSTEDTRESFKIEIQIKNNIVSWKDSNNRAQSDNNLHLSIFLDTSANTALFRLHGDIPLTYKETTSSRQAIYLFIHPEDIRSITLESTADVPPMNTLCFSLKRTPYLVAPKDCVLMSESEDECLLRSIQALSTLTNFDVHLNRSGMNSLSTPDLERVASVFSSNHKIAVDATRANLNTLYGDSVGEVVNSNKGVTSLEANLLPYDEAATVSDTLDCEPQNLDIQNRQSATAHSHAPFSPQDILTRFGAISSGLEALCSLLNGMNSRLERLEKMTAVALDAGNNLRHYGTEERADMLAEVNRLVDEGIVDFKTECEDIAKETLKELRNEFNEAAEQLRNEALKKMGETEE